MAELKAIREQNTTLMGQLSTAKEQAARHEAKAMETGKIYEDAVKAGAEWRALTIELRKDAKEEQVAARQVQRRSR